MSETTVNLGMLPNNRGSYTSETWTQNPPTIYKDNIVEFNNSAYIYSPVSFDIANPAASATGNPPYDVATPTVLNTGWYVFASGNNTFTTGEKVENVGIDDEPTAGSENLVKSGGVYDDFQSVEKQLTGEIEPFLVKGQIDTTTYEDKASNYHLRTDFLEHNYIVKVEVNSPYIVKYFYYNTQKVGTYNADAFIPNYTDTPKTYVRLVIRGGTGTSDTWTNIGLKITYTNSIDGRLTVVEKNANYSQYDALLEQGGLAFSNGSIIDSDTYVRTRFLTYNFIGKVSIDNGYDVYALFYGQNKSYISYNQLVFTDGVCELPGIQNAVYVAFIIKFTNNADIQPSDVTSFRLYPKEQEQQIDVEKAFRSYALVNILEQGSLTHANGIETDSTKYVRTPYIPYDALYKIKANSGYIVHMFLYSDLDSFIYHYALDFTDEYVIPYLENAKYLRFSIQKSDTTADITPTDNIGFKLLGFSDYREDELNEKNTRDFIKVNTNNLPILTACFTQSTDHVGFTDFCSFVVTDLHGDMLSLGDTKDAIAYLRKKMIPTKTIACLCCGDICLNTPKEDGAISSDIAPYMAYAEDLAIYHTMGQHEVGFRNTTTGRAKNNCFSHQEVFNTFISPLKTVWGLPNLDTIYYYKDFADSNTRLISLYQFNIPLVDDPSDSSLYKYPRMVVWYGQDQINWLIQTLNSTPSNYRVVVLMHEPEGRVLPTPKKLFFTGSSAIGGNLIINGTPIYDIVSAYVAKTTLSQSYICKDTTTYPTEDFTLDVNADFSQANGDFACFVTGDIHVDYMGVVENTSLIDIGMTPTSAQTADFTLYKEFGETTAWAGNNLASSIVRCLGLCHSERLIKVGGLGQQYTNTGEYRNYGAISY